MQKTAHRRTDQRVADRHTARGQRHGLPAAARPAVRPVELSTTETCDDGCHYCQGPETD